MRWYINDFRKGIVPEGTFSNDDLLRLVVRGKITKSNIMNAVFVLGFPLILTMSKKNYALGCVEDGNTLLDMFSCTKFTTLVFERPSRDVWRAIESDKTTLVKRRG